MPFADICVEDRETCPNEWPVLFYQQETHQTQEVRIRDRHGAPVDISHHAVCLIAKEEFITQQLYINATAEITDVAEAAVEISLDCEELSRPGLFLGELVVIDTGIPVEEEECDSSSSCESSEDSSAEESSAEDSSSSCDSSECPVEEPPCDNIVYRAPCYVEVSPNLANPSFWSQSWGVLTIAEIRLAIRDKCREDNFLLDNVEFSDTEIAWAIRRPVECWNERLPPLRTVYTAATFPYRYYWLIGVVGELLQIAAPHYERNRLRYSAAGLSVDDKDKAGFYERAAQKYLDEYRKWVDEKKYSINLGNAYGRTEIASFGNDGYFGRSGSGLGNYE